jgi:hypothetical protein
MDESSTSLSPWYYALAALVFLAGCGVLALFLTLQLHGLSTSLLQIVAPGATELGLTQAGDYTIFYERRSVIGRRVYSTGERLVGLECQLVSQETGAGVLLSGSATSITYSIAGRSGRSIFHFHVDRPGVYTLTSRYSDGRIGPQVVLSIGYEFSTRMFAIAFGSVVIMLGSMAIALAIVIVTAVKRDRAKRQLITHIVSEV